METIKVNMSPNPLDVQTIHASQNDNEAREWGFELHNNGEKIDSSEISDQLVFKAYKGGTEEILPTDGSVPVTAPFLGDIRYPQGLLTDQEFLYRQSPTEKDGNAKITDIKGNTLVWNQLVQNGNFADTSKWTKGSGASSLAISNNEAVITIGGAWNNDARQHQGASFISGHKYFASFEAKATVPITVALASFNATPEIYFAMLTNLETTFKKIASIVTAQSNADSFRIVLDGSGNSYVGETFTVRNVQIIDLTAMGLDITDPSEFTSLFPLSYYSYNQGSLLSFNGNGIKTTGKNLLNARTTQTTNGITFTNDNGVITINGTATANAFFVTNIGLHNGSYFIGIFNDEINNYIHVAVQNKSGAYPLDATLGSKNKTLSLNNDIDNFIIWINNGATLNNFVLKPMISFESPEYFEPYTSSTLSLPISTYFPNGMKSAGNVYDELTPSKAITRIGMVDLGTLTWSYVSTYTRFRALTSGQIPDIKKYQSVRSQPFMCAIYMAIDDGRSISNVPNMSVYNDFNTNAIFITNTSYTDATTFKSAMSGVYLYYELATPTETSFTTASIVTENAEIPLSNEDGVLIGKCTEQLSENPGFIDAKIKLSDSDGECYSNKIQLHVERSPQ